MTAASRPEEQLAELLRDYPKLGRKVDLFLGGKGDDLPGWPDDVLLPVPAWQAIAQGYGLDLLAGYGEMCRMQAVGTWRYAKGIYRFGDELARELLEMELPEELPMGVFRRLPDYCPYIVAPEQLEDGLHGWYVNLDYDYRTGAWELRIYADRDGWPLIAAPIELSHGGIADNLATFAWPLLGELGKDVEGAGDEARGALASMAGAPVKLLLYLCSDAPDVQGRVPGESPGSARVVSTRKGRRIFEPPQARTWDVGSGLSRSLAEFHGSVQGRKRPHVRRAHWHGYWTGPRGGERTFRYHWQPPVFVNPDLADGGE